MKNKYKYLIIFHLLAAFAAGLLGGIFSERYYFHNRRHARMAREERGSVHFPSLEQMSKELGLSTEQQDQIKKIFEDNEAKLKELRGDMHARLSTIRSELKSKIHAVLTPEQKQKLESMIDKYLQQRKEEYEKRGQQIERERSRDKSKGDVR